jgi:glycosyltransferase involved in cell wall biosynthesis
MEDGAEIHHHHWPSLFGHPVGRARDLQPHVEWADLVLTSQYTAAPAAAATARRLGTPIVFVAHEFLGPRWRQVESPVRARGFAAFERWVFGRPYDWFVGVSQATSRDLIDSGRDSRRVTTINPVFNDFGEWRAVADRGADSRTFLFYGRPGKTKGVFVLLEAIARLDSTLEPEWRFDLILSDDPVREKRAAAGLVRERGLAERVQISDPVPQPVLMDHLSRAYCVIVPSLTEGFGFSAYQACCMGKNIIASDAGSLPEVVSGRSLLFERGKPGSLADAITRATRGEFEQRPDRVARDGAEQMLALCRSLLS